MSRVTCSSSDPIVTYIPTVGLGAASGLFAGLTGNFWICPRSMSDRIAGGCMSFFPGALTLGLLGFSLYLAGQALDPENRMSRKRRFVNLAMSGAGMLVCTTGAAYLVMQAAKTFLTVNCNSHEDFEQLVGVLLPATTVAGAALANSVHLGAAALRVCKEK